MVGNKACYVCCLSASSECHQIVSIICVGLVAGVGGLALTFHKLAVVYGTLIGFLMISIIVVVGSVIDGGLSRTLVSQW